MNKKKKKKKKNVKRMRSIDGNVKKEEGKSGLGKRK